MHEHDNRRVPCSCGWVPAKSKPDVIQSVLNIKTDGVQLVKNGALSDGYHVINDVEYLVLTAPAALSKP